MVEWANPRTAPPPGTRLSFSECGVSYDMEAQRFVEFEREAATSMKRDEFAGLPDAIAGRARRFKDSDPGISKAEAVTRAFSDPQARRAYADSVSRHNRAVARGTAKGPQETRQWGESVRQFNDRTGNAGSTPGEGTYKPATSGGSTTRDGKFVPDAGGPQYDTLDDLGPILDRAITKIIGMHPEYTRAQAIAEAMKIPAVAQAYQDSISIENA
jgi:hypothetical protein